MKRINDIFYSIQGEGRNAGRAAAFVRFAGCNLRCAFCDTDFDSFRLMSDEEIISEISRWRARLVILTGGEPTLQTDAPFVEKLHEAGFEVVMETNGTNIPPGNVDWITCSPKTGVRLRRCNELKCLFDENGPADSFGIEADYHYLQPCDTGDVERNRRITAACTEYVKEHPEWRLSLQIHKLAGFK